ncbi:MAG: hypothetical protein ABUT20_12145, partial [Bacteroidota bacterium]
MKSGFLLCLLFFVCVSSLFAQRRCASFQYAQQAMRINPSLQTNQRNIEAFIQSRLRNSSSNAINTRPASLQTIEIPVVVHVVYHNQQENISDVAIAKQLTALNRDYQRMNADSSNTPDA